VFHLDLDNPEQVIFRCKYEKEPLSFEPKTKTPCKRFMPKEYIQALNFDTR
jgi:hypothetical protein